MILVFLCHVQASEEPADDKFTPHGQHNLQHASTIKITLHILLIPTDFEMDFTHKIFSIDSN